MAAIVHPGQSPGWPSEPGQEASGQTLGLREGGRKAVGGGQRDVRGAGGPAHVPGPQLPARGRAPAAEPAGRALAGPDPVHIRGPPEGPRTAGAAEGRGQLGPGKASGTGAPLPSSQGLIALQPAVQGGWHGGRLGRQCLAGGHGDLLDLSYVICPFLESDHVNKNRTGTPGDSWALGFRSGGGSAGKIADLGARPWNILEVGDRGPALPQSQESVSLVGVPAAVTTSSSCILVNTWCVPSMRYPSASSH